MTRSMRRRGLTLVEMLVASALIIFVMTILASVFTSGITALRNLRGVGHLQDNLRTAGNILRRDLAAPHFGREVTATAGPSLSQQRLDLADWSPPSEGFFRITQGGISASEGFDGDGIPVYRATNHSLHFTVRMEPSVVEGGGRDRAFLTNQIPAAFMSGMMMPASTTDWRLPPTPLSHLNTTDQTSYASRWAEVAYFVAPSGQSAGGTPLNTLYRRRRVLIDSRSPNEDFVAATINPMQRPQAAADLATDASMFAVPTSTPAAYYNTSADIANPLRRYGVTPTLPAINAQSTGNVTGLSATDLAALAGLANYLPINQTVASDATTTQALRQSAGGDDILLENVISFEVRVHWDTPNLTSPTLLDRSANPTYAPTLAAANVRGPRNTLASDYPFDLLPESPAGFGNSLYANAAGPYVFDTWCGRNNYQWIGTGQSPLNIPLRVRVKAIQVRVRVWDIKTQQARQITIVQDL